MTHAPDFTRPVELTCVLNADTAMPRLIPALLVQAFAIWLLVALPLGVMFPHVAAVSLFGGIAVAAAVCIPRYLRKRDELRHTYGVQQRLVLHPGGLHKVDGTVAVDMAWASLSGFQYRNSALPSARNPILTGNAMAPAAAAAKRRAHTVMGWGIVGPGTISPLPGASPRRLKVHDRLGKSNLRHGVAHTSPQCLIFPAEFEQDWQHGTIAAWLQHYRPDLQIPG